MSLTAELTPYDAEEAERQRAAREQEQAAKRERVTARRKARLRESRTGLTEASRVPLHVGSVGSLSAAASQLGFRAVELSESRARLEHPAGEFVEIRRRGSKTEVLSRKGARAVREIVRQHTISTAVEHCRKLGYEVRARRLPGGEVQIEGIERQPAAGQQARVEVEVRPDGRLTVDVRCVEGEACGRIVSELSQAVGAVSETSRRKPEFFRQSSEAQRTKQRT